MTVPRTRRPSSPGSRRPPDPGPAFAAPNPFPAFSVLILRLIGIFALIAIGVSLALYAVRREQRYLRFAWRIFLGTLVFVALLMVFYVAERLLMVV